MGEDSLLRSAVKRAAAITGPRCVVVLGADAGRLRSELAGLAVHIVVNRAWREGLGTSLRRGIDALPASASAALVTLADLYALGEDDLWRLASAWVRHPRGAAAASLAGQAVAPAILPRRLFRRLWHRGGDEGARRVLRATGEDVTLVDLPTAEYDLDEPDDLRRLRRHRALPVVSRRR